MDHEKQVFLVPRLRSSRRVEEDDDAFSRTQNVSNGQADDRRDRRIDRAQHERAEQVQLLEASADNARLERFDVENDVRKLWQRS